MSILEAARWYVAQGVSVIPVKADGSKAPKEAGWRQYSNELPADADLVRWFGGTDLAGIGVPAGPASGNLVVLDFECHGLSAYAEWYLKLPDDLRQLADRLPTVSTPSGGRHVWVRLPEPQPGGKLARYAAGKTKIEIRGEGHQVLAPGCPAECHATGKLYEWVSDPAFVEVEPEEWAALCEWAAGCNDYEVAEQPRDRGTGAAGTPAGADSPGNDFNRRGTWAEAGLFDAGWTWSREVGPDRGFVTRPGKDSGISASVGMVSSRESGYPYLFVWSTSTDFATETPFSRFAVYAHLKHGGDYSEAAKSLARLGYGERPGVAARKPGVDLSGFSMKLNTPGGTPFFPFAGQKPGGAGEGADAPPTPPAAEARPFKWASELDSQTEDATWIWTGYLARSGITLFSALWKSGKSTLLSHLLKSLDGSKTEFLGQKVVPSRVLYVTEEAENIWAGRRDSLMLGDHVGFACRPFQMRPTMAEWRDYLRVIAEQVARHHFDLVVFDTLSKMWPVREENDAGQVEEALMPLWSISKEGVAVLLVHHTRKSGGGEFVASRGSGGLPAFCEILVEFGKPENDPNRSRRILTGVGRYEQTPHKLLAELTPSGYVGLGDPDDVAVADARAGTPCRFDWEPDLWAILNEATDWLTYQDLVDALKAKRGKAGRKETIGAWLDGKIDGGELEVDGTGKGRSGFRYRVPRINDTEEA